MALNDSSAMKWRRFCTLSGIGTSELNGAFSSHDFEPQKKSPFYNCGVHVACHTSLEVYVNLYFVFTKKSW